MDISASEVAVDGASNLDEEITEVPTGNRRAEPSYVKHGISCRSRPVTMVSCFEMIFASTIAPPRVCADAPAGTSIVVASAVAASAMTVSRLMPYLLCGCLCAHPLFDRPRRAAAGADPCRP